MWGETWGTMIWGAPAVAVEQVPIGPWAMLLLGFLLGVSAVMSRRHCVVRMVPLLVVFLVPIIAVAANLSVSGGRDNNASDSGGQSNTASGQSASVSGGFGRSATSTFNWAGGGLLENL